MVKQVDESVSNLTANGRLESDDLKTATLSLKIATSRTGLNIDLT